MSNTEYRHIKIPVQTITQKEADQIKHFLLNQPRYRFLKDGEAAENTNRYAKEGVVQHWLWMKKNQATSWDDFITEWGIRADPNWIKTDRKHLIMPGELFLCDLVGGELWVGRLEHSDRNFRATKLFQISNDMNRDYGNCFNGYAILPNWGEMLEDKSSE